MSGRPIRVLHLRDSPWVDGPGRTILETGRHIDGSRIEYHIGAFASGTHEHPLIAGARARGLNIHEIEDSPGIKLRLVRRVVELIDDLGIDVLHTSEFRSNVLALVCRRYRKVTLISTVHGWIANDRKGRIFRLSDKVALRFFDAVICVSQKTRSLLPRWWVSSRRVHVLPNALVTGEYGSDVVGAPRVLRDVSKGAVLLNVGRLSPEKAQDLLIHAVAQLSPTYPGLRLRIAGTGPSEAELRALACKLKIEDRVEFLGYIHDMPPLYREVDVVVQSSLTEGLPNVILEAAYLKIPIVATRVGGTAEVIEHKQSGWLINPASISELVDGIRHFLEHPDEFARMGSAAHERIRASFSFDVRTERLMNIYETVAGTGRPCTGGRALMRDA